MLRRVSTDAREGWADQRLDEALAEMRRAPERTYLFVSAAGATPELERAVAVAGLPYRRVRAERRDSLVIGPRASAGARDVAGLQ